MLEIRILALPRTPASEICRKYGFRSVVDNSPETEVVMVLKTRLQTVSGTLGLSQALWVVEHQDELPVEFMALLGKIWIDFPATIAVFSYGRRMIPFLDQDGSSRWYLYWIPLSSRCDSGDRVALAK